MDSTDPNKENTMYSIWNKVLEYVGLEDYENAYKLLLSKSKKKKFHIFLLNI